MSDLAGVSAAGREALEALRADPGRGLLGVDFDGTLSPIVPDPEHAYAEPRAVDALARLGARLGTVAVVTGRPARQVVELGGFAGRAGLESLVVLGQYGVERWDASTGQFSIPPAPAAVTAFGAELPGLLRRLDLADARVEDKGRALGVHTRQLPDPRGAYARLRQPLTGLAERHGLTVEPGRNVLEVRAPGVDKGGALRGVVAERGARTVLFAGDDLGDLPAFRAVVELRAEGVPGLLVCSGSEEEDALTDLADVVVDGPGGVAGWFGDLAAWLDG